MKYILKNKKEEPQFRFFVKLNTSNMDYWLFNDIERALNHARVLSLTSYPISVVYEPVRNADGEWKLQKTYAYFGGKCNLIESPKVELHVKFYTQAGEWMNADEF